MKILLTLTEQHGKKVTATGSGWRDRPTTSVFAYALQKAAGAHAVVVPRDNPPA